MRGHFADTGPLTRPHIDAMHALKIVQYSVAGGLSDVVYIDEIPAFLAILKNTDRTIQPRQIGKNCQDSGVRIRQRLAWAKDVLVPQGHSRNPQRRTE